MNPVALVCHPGDHARGQEASQSRTHYVLLSPVRVTVTFSHSRALYTVQRSHPDEVKSLHQQPVITKRPERMKPRAIANWSTHAEEKYKCYTKRGLLKLTLHAVTLQAFSQF